MSQVWNAAEILIWGALMSLSSRVIFAFLAAAITAPCALASTISFSVGASSGVELADSFSNSAFSNTITVPDGGSGVFELQPGTFNLVFQSATGSKTFSLTETFVANGITGSIALNPTLTVTTAADTLSYPVGTPTIITLATGQTLTVTPLALSITQSNQNSYPYVLDARFALSPAVAVPGPTVGAGASSFALAALFLGWLVRRRGHQMV